MSKWKSLISLILFFAVVAISVSGCSSAPKTMNSDHAKNSPAQAQNQSGKSSSNNEFNSNNSTTNNEINSKVYPETKDITWKSEGVPNKETFKLLNITSLPFISYIPTENWSVISTDNSVRINYKKYGQIEILFMKNGINQQEAEHEFKKLLNSHPNLEKTDKQLPKWVISSWFLSERPNENRNDWKNIYAILGKHNNNYFYIYYYVNLDGAEVFTPIQQIIFNEWRWKDTGESLGYSEN